LNRELDVVGTFRELAIVFEGVNYPTIDAFFQRLPESVRSGLDALVDVRRGDAGVVRVDAELVIDRVWVRLPL
jgi:hypothetical protein